MKSYNAHTYEKLGFDVILEEVARRCLSEEAREIARSLSPISHVPTLLEELQRVNEFREILLFDDPFPLDRLPSVGSALQKLALEGNWLRLEELRTLLGWLQTAEQARAYMHSRREKYPLLYGLILPDSFQKSLIATIKGVIDPAGNLRDDASHELSRIRHEIRRVSGELRGLLQKILRKANEHRWSEASAITLRNERLVIPVKTDAKGRIPGFVQDVSSSGNTVFIEPAESLPMNNRLRELQIGEQNEIMRILQTVSSKIAEHLEPLQAFTHVMIAFDFLRARARLAVDLDAVLPVVNPEATDFKLREAYYPLLVLKARTEDIQVIPLDVGFNEEQRIIVISGPNAGGKSVSLKTVGLIQLMLQCGLLVPVDARSEFRLFDSLFLDIGDEQSIESDLSTYTSHLAQMRIMGDHMNSQSLFLIDEFGTGTDPKLGGAIAEAFLHRFVRQGAYGIITTHYGNIKDYAETAEGITNAAMQFDTKGLKPTFRLVEGLPGRSYAFEIAKKVGVHYTILRNARKKLGKRQLTSEQLLRQLEEKNSELEHLVTENQAKEARLSTLVEKNEALQKELTQNSKAILREAQIEAKQLIKDANRRIEQTIREIKETQANKELTKKLRKRLADATPEVVEVEEGFTPPLSKKAKKAKVKPKAAEIELLPDETPIVGDFVKLKSSQSHGKLVELQGKRAIVEVGELKLTVKLGQLIKIRPPQQAKSRNKTLGINRKIGQTRTELDVIGMRVEAALVEVEKLVDEALMDGLPYVRILHGKGSGALREGIRNYLRDLVPVKRLTDETIEAGGAGWTVVELKE